MQRNFFTSLPKKEYFTIKHHNPFRFLCVAGVVIVFFLPLFLAFPPPGIQPYHNRCVNLPIFVVFIFSASSTILVISYWDINCLFVFFGRVECFLYLPDTENIPFVCNQMLPQFMVHLTGAGTH